MIMMNGNDEWLLDDYIHDYHYYDAEWWLLWQLFHKIIVILSDGFVDHNHGTLSWWLLTGVDLQTHIRVGFICSNLRTDGKGNYGFLMFPVSWKTESDGERMMASCDL